LFPCWRYDVDLFSVVHGYFDVDTKRTNIVKQVAALSLDIIKGVVMNKFKQIDLAFGS